MSAFPDRLRDGPCLLLDGGLGSEMIARGLRVGTPPDLWTIERPEILDEIHRGYVEAGSEAVHANTFGANPIRLRAFGLEDRCADLNRIAVARARASGARFVIADIGPTGEYLPPVGNGDASAWAQAFREQVRVLAEMDAPVDALHIETMSDLREAMVALEAARRFAPGIPALVSLTFDRKKRGFFTIMGDPLRDALVRLHEAGAVAVGANCTLASGDMRVLAEEARALDVPLVIQPNAGQPRMQDARPAYDQSPEEFAEDVARVAVFASAVGGCCGTDPRFIGALRARMDAARENP